MTSRALTQSAPNTTELVANDHRVLSGVFLAIAGTFLFALKSIMIKSAFAAGADTIVLLTLRLLFAFPFYLGMLCYLRFCSSSVSPSRKATPQQIAKSVALGFLGYYLASFLDMAGLERISAQLERLTLFTYPAMVAILAWFFLREQLTGRIVASIFLSYCGIATMYSQERNIVASTSQTTVGVFLVLGSALSFSFYVLLAKPLMQQIGSRQFTSYAMIGSCGFVVIHFLATRSFARLVSAESWVYGYGFALAFVCTVIPSFLVNEAIVRLGAARTTVIGSVGPVVTMALAITLLGEPTSIYHIAGMMIVILGVSLVARK